MWSVDTTHKVTRGLRIQLDLQRPKLVPDFIEGDVERHDAIFRGDFKNRRDGMLHGLLPCLVERIERCISGL